MPDGVMFSDVSYVIVAGSNRTGRKGRP